MNDEKKYTGSGREEITMLQGGAGLCMLCSTTTGRRVDTALLLLLSGVQQRPFIKVNAFALPAAATTTRKKSPPHN